MGKRGVSVRLSVRWLVSHTFNLGERAHGFHLGKIGETSCFSRLLSLHATSSLLRLTSVEDRSADCCRLGTGRPKTRIRRHERE